MTKLKSKLDDLIPREKQEALARVAIQKCDSMLGLLERSATRMRKRIAAGKYAK